jgi:hypothetical protein
VWKKLATGGKRLGRIDDLETDLCGGHADVPKKQTDA